MEHRCVVIGVVLAITPFIAPLNTVCHKIGPALAAGNVVILKPAEYTPLTAQALVHVLREAGVPEGYLQILYGSGAEVGLRRLREARIGFTTFTVRLTSALRLSSCPRAPLC